nr:MAG TPA: hypothetical protein [Caudoviricetes sp.]
MCKITERLEVSKWRKTKIFPPPKARRLLPRRLSRIFPAPMPRPRI